jgi:hypothetical protein
MQISKKPCNEETHSHQNSTLPQQPQPSRTLPDTSLQEEVAAVVAVVAAVAEEVIQIQINQ